MTNDADLLAQHHAGSDDAFAAIVRRHADWISGVARRRVGDDAALADDVVQATFLVLAQKSRSIGGGVPLSAWLFRVACNVSGRALRDRQRRAKHERQAAMTSPPAASPAEWEELAPALDALVEQLKQADREAILLRFYRQLTYAEVGGALGIGEEAARKRVERAVERLRDAARRRGIAIGAATFAGLLASNMTPAPAAAGTVAIATTAAASESTLVGGNIAALATGAFVTTSRTCLAAGVTAMLAVGVGVAVVANRDGNAASATRPTTATASATPFPGNSTIEQLNLRRMGQVLNLYANTHGDRFPPTLGATLTFHAANADDPADLAAAAQMLTDPAATGGPLPDEMPTPVTPAWVDAHTPLGFPAHDCDVMALYETADLDGLIVLHGDLDAPHVGERDLRFVNVCYLSGKSEAMALDAARRRLQRDESLYEWARQMADLPPTDRLVYRTQSKAKQIATALSLAAGRGPMPATLGEVLPYVDLRRGLQPTDNPRVFLTPADLETIRPLDVEQTPAWVDANTSFDYLGAGAVISRFPSADSGTTILVHTRLNAPLTAKDGKQVVVCGFADGHSESLYVDAMPAAIEASRKRLDAAR